MKLYKETKTIYQKIRKYTKGTNDLIGKTTGFKIKRVPYSRPSTLAALEKFGSKEIRAIEIGCAAGRNALDILQKINVSELVLIDPYDLVIGEYDDYTVARLNLMQEQAKDRLSNYDDRITWVTKTSTDALRDLHGKYDFIYVDGDHSYKHAYEDIKNYLSFLSDEFVFGGHDIMQDGVSKAICQLIKEGKIDKVSLRDPDWIISS